MRSRSLITLVPVLLAVEKTHALTATPIWLTKPSCSTEAALKAAVPLQMLPPRRLEETHVDERGRPTTGRCLPFALLLQMQRLADVSEDASLPTGTTLRDAELVRDRVLDFAIAQQAAPWRPTDAEYGTLGDIVAAVAESRGWGPTRPRSLAVRAWAARLRATPKVGCDAAFLFSAAACYGVRVHVHYKTKTGLMADTQFAAPATAPQAMRPRADVHIGYCENSDSTNHYVSLPALWER